MFLVAPSLMKFGPCSGNGLGSELNKQAKGFRLSRGKINQYIPNLREQNVSIGMLCAETVSNENNNDKKE